MADTVDVSVKYSSPKYHVVTLTNESDGTGEAAVAKVDISTLTGPDGTTPSALVVEEILWNVSSGYVVVEFNHTTPDEIAVLTGSGYTSYREIGGFKDPGSSGGTGDIQVTTDGFADGDGYTITMFLRKKD